MKIVILEKGEKTREVIKRGVDGTLIGIVSLDTELAEKEWDGIPIYSIKNMPKEYDVIFTIERVEENILDILEENGIPLEKVCFYQPPIKYMVDKGANFRKCAAFLPQESLIMIPGYEEDDEYNFIKHDLLQYNRLQPRESLKYDENEKRFYYRDKYSQAGAIKNYFWQDLWAAQLIFQNNPKVHYDIGSRIDGFIAHLLSFRSDVTLIDIRPLEKTVPGLGFVRADATNLDGFDDNSIESLSALCSLEHFGLGRYGDEVDPEACFKAFDAIQRKMMPGGFAYISVPVGREHVEYNAHRIFSVDTIIKSFSKMELVRFDAADNFELKKNVDIHQYDGKPYTGDSVYGLFQFRKK